MKYARINLNKTNYTQLTNFKIITTPDIYLLNEIYKKYCQYKNFESVVPIFENEYRDPNTDVFGYYENSNLIAFTMVKRQDNSNVENYQFAWNYSNPKLRLGIESLKNECAYYKQYGYKYMYLGYDDIYKSEIDGYELVEPI